MLARVQEHLDFLNAWRTTAGLGPALDWEWLQVRRRFGANPTVWRVQPQQAAHPLEVRLGASSDFNVFRQIFVDEEYGALRGVNGVRTVLDLGANVGYTSAFFLNCYPQAHVLALEPDPNNAAPCRRNLAPYAGRAELLQGAVWSSRSSLQVERRGKEWATQVKEASANGAATDTVEGWDMPTLIERLGGHIDILKVDIEGAEAEVFRSGAAEWLRHVGNLCIELHGADCERIFEAALQPFEFNRSISGELTVCRNIRPRR